MFGVDWFTDRLLEKQRRMTSIQNNKNKTNT